MGNKRPLGAVPTSLLASMSVGVMLRLMFVLIGSGGRRFANPDTSSYVGFARRFPSILWSSDPQGLIYSLQRTPGYPTFVWAATGGGRLGLTAAVVVQCLIGGALNVWLCWILARRMFGPSVASIAALLVALDPISIAHSLLIATETVFTSVLLVMLVLVDRVRTGAVDNADRDGRNGEPSGPLTGLPGGLLIGLSVGVLALIRPAAVYLGPVVAGVVWVLSSRGTVGHDRVQAVVRGAGVLLASSVLVFGWSARNEAVSGTFLFSTAQGQNLFEYGAAAAAADAGAMSVVPPSQASGWSDLDVAKRRLEARFPKVTEGVDMSDPVNQDAAWTELGWRSLREHPRGYGVVAVQATVRTLGGPGHTLLGDLLVPNDGEAIRSLLLLVAVGALALQYGGAAIGLWIGLSTGKRRQLLVLLVPVAYLLVVSAGPQAYARFRVPLAPMICIVAGLGIAHVRSKLANRQGDSGEVHAPGESQRHGGQQDPGRCQDQDLGGPAGE